MEGRLATGMQGKNKTNILWLLLGREARKLGQIHELEASGKLLINYTAL